MNALCGSQFRVVCDPVMFALKAAQIDFTYTGNTFTESCQKVRIFASLSENKSIYVTAINL